MSFVMIPFCDNQNGLVNFSHLKVKRLQSTVKLQADRALKFREEIEVYGATVHIRAKLYIFTEYQKGDQS